MTFVNHLQGAKTDELFAEVAFGEHVIEGDLAKSIVTGSSPTHVVTIQQILGDTFGKGWKGVKGLWFRGVNRPAAKFKFFQGKQTANPVEKVYTADNTTDTLTSTAHGYTNGTEVIFRPGDLPAPLVSGTVYYVVAAATNTFQVSATNGGAAINLTTNGTGTLAVFANVGYDSVFNQDIPHSNTAWIRAECPNGAETGIPEFDTKNNPPTGLSGIYECQLGDVYNSSGTVTSSDVLLTNPADVLAFGCIEIRRYPTSRIDWAALDTLRSLCDVTATPNYTTLLPHGVGLTGSYYDGSAFNTFKSKRWDPVIQYDLSTGAPALDITPTGFSVRFEGKIRFKYTQTYTMYLTHNDSGKLWIDNLTTAIIDQASAGTHSATFAATADQWYDIKMEWTNASGDSQFMLEWQSAAQARQVVPQDRLYPKAEALKRFECHAAFTQRTTFDDFLRSVLFTCNGSFQDVNGKLKFFNIDDLSTSFDFTEANVVKNTFKAYPRFTQQELLQMPNRFVADGRDRMSRYLEKFDPQVYYDLSDLQEAAGRVIEETVVVGNTTRPQALANLAHYAKIRTSSFVCEFEGMPQTFPVLPADLVRVTQPIVGWTNKRFLAIEATDKSIDSNPDERIFKLLEWL